MKEKIKQLITGAINKLYPNVEVRFSIDSPPAGLDADFASNAALVLAKKVGEKPMEVAEKILRLAQSDKDYAITIATPGFLNFKINSAALLRVLDEIIKTPEKYGTSNIGKNKLAIVEYFQLNVAKPPHVGHLRSAVIGDSLKRILNAVGYKVVSDTHVGDWGTQFGLLLLAYKTLDGEKRVKDRPLEELNELYIEINKLIEKTPELREQAKQEFVKLEKGDKENRKLWEFFIKVSHDRFVEIAQVLGLQPFEYDLGESFYDDKIPVVLSRLLDAGLLTKGETGEQYVDLEKFGLGRLICVKSDGGTTYEMRDLATLAYRYDTLAKKEKIGLAWNLYVVDTRQAHDFRQVFKTMEFLGYDVSKSRHIEFGYMSLPEGAMSSRKGNVVSLEDLIAEADKRALAVIQKKNPDLKNKEEIAKSVGLGALKYFDLIHNRKSGIVFRWDEALNFEGNTGPYLQYTHARLRSILRKAGVTGKLETKHSEFKPGSSESVLLRTLVLYPDIILAAAGEFMPSTLAAYLYLLAGKINNFYHASPVLQEKDEEIKNIRLALVDACSLVLRNGLNLLGMDAPEEM